MSKNESSTDAWGGVPHPSSESDEARGRGKKWVES